MKTFLSMLLVGFAPMIQAETLEKSIDCLAKNIYHEARNQSIKGQYAVGFVTMNRVKSGNYPSTICGVVYQKAQFSWTMVPGLKINFKGKAWAQAVSIAKFLLKYPKLRDQTKGALFYHTKAIRPFWSKSMAVVAVIDSHIFY